MLIESAERLVPAPSATIPQATAYVRADARLHLAASTPQFAVYVTRDPDEVRAAQRLRYRVFSEEFGAVLPGANGIDRDLYDPYCDHLIVRCMDSREVVGTYRMLPPEHARHLGHYADNEFFTTRLNPLKAHMVEFGRSCVHPDYRSGAVIMLLWAGLAAVMQQRGFEHVIGCASVSLRDGGHAAASLYNRLKDDYLAAPEFQVFPRNPLPLNKLRCSLEVEAPPLIKGYLRIGARICGEPAWDRDFNAADFFMLMSLDTMNPRYARHFGLVSA